MIKMIYLTCLLMLGGAGILFWVSAMPWAEGTAQDGSEASGLKRLSMAASRPDDGGTRDVASPLVEQAAAFARYLQPPAPPKEAARPKAALQPAPRPPTATPQFRLLATTYCHSSPEKSLALIAEPGKVDRWTRPGEHLGHFVIERIENGTIIYRDGNQRREMTVTMKEPVELARLLSTLSASARTVNPNVGLVTASQPKGGGIGMPGAPATTYEQE